MWITYYFDKLIKNLYDGSSKITSEEFEMSMMGELTNFLGFSVNQRDDGTFFNLGKYIKNIFKKYEIENTKAINIDMSYTI